MKTAMLFAESPRPPETPRKPGRPSIAADPNKIQVGRMADAALKVNPGLLVKQVSAHCGVSRWTLRRWRVAAARREIVA